MENFNTFGINYPKKTDRGKIVVSVSMNGKEYSKGFYIREEHDAQYVCKKIGKMGNAVAMWILNEEHNNEISKKEFDGFFDEYDKLNKNP